MTTQDAAPGLTSTDLPGSHGRRRVHLPENEIFRLRQIFDEGEYAIPAHYLPSGRLVIVDVGANVGLFALFMKTVRCDSDIHCFEPVPQSLRLLEKNIQGHERILVHPHALSNVTGREKIYLQPSNSGEHSLKRRPGLQEQAVTVDVIDAETAFQQLGLSYIDILKIDTEGCEVEILESIRQRLPYVGIVMAEYHSEADRRRIDDLLQNHQLFEARVCTPQLGMVKYINSRLL